MDLVLVILQAASLIALSLAVVAVALKCIVRPDSSVDGWTVIRFFSEVDLLTAKRVRSREVPAWVTGPPSWLRTSKWLRSRLEGRTVELGALSGLNPRHLATAYSVNLGSFALTGALALPILITIGVVLFGPQTGVRAGLVVAAAVVGAGVVATLSLHKELTNEASQRLAALRLQLPFATDFLALVLDAGGTLDDAIESYVVHGPECELRTELRLALQELRTGASREEVFSRLAGRCPAREIQRLHLVVSQAGRMGTPLIDVFRQQAEMLRLERLQRASETADRMAIDAAFPFAGVAFALLIVMVAPFLLEALGGAGEIMK